MIELLSITCDVDYARRLWALPGNTVMVDLESIGKSERQAASNTLISSHTMDDARALAGLPGRGPLLVRTNAACHGAPEEAAALAELGVDRVMLPMFTTRAEVESVVDALERSAEGSVRLTLLAETNAGVERIGEILDGLPAWVDHVHVGLNDLCLERRSRFLFEPVRTGEIERIARAVQAHGRRFGFGGLGMPGEGPVPPEQLVGEHVRVGSECVILSRAFHTAVDSDDPEALERGVAEVRRWEERWRAASEDELLENRGALGEAIARALEAKR